MRKLIIINYGIEQHHKTLSNPKIILKLNLK